MKYPIKIPHKNISYMRTLNIAIDYRLANMSYRGMARYCREITYDLIKAHPNDNWILFIDQSSEFRDKGAIRGTE